MKKKSVAAVALVLAIALFVVLGCGDEATETSTTMMQDTTTMQDTATTMPEGTSTTQVGTSTTSGGTDTTQGGPQGVGIPEAVPGAYTDLNPEQAKQLIDTMPDLVVIDVSLHYDEGHLPGAVHYYLADGSLEAAIPSLDKEVPYLVYCHVDRVAIAGAQALVDAGFPTVYRLEGNYSAWVDAGYPVEK